MKLKSMMLCLAVMCGHLINAQKQVDIRMNGQYFDSNTKTLYVDLSVRYQGLGSIHLGDQNYRIYFDSNNLRPQQSDYFLELPRDQYSDVHWLEVIEGRSATHIGKLDFDDHLGFINLSIDLLDDLNGGISLRKEDGWKRIMNLKFDVLDENKICQAVWSHNGKTEQYATAFVEILEWISPNHEKAVMIENVYDLLYMPEISGRLFDVTIGPNPAIEFIKINFGDFADQNGHVSITNALGERVIDHKKNKGTSEIILDMTEMSSATYNVELFDSMSKRVYQESFVITR